VRGEIVELRGRFDALGERDDPKVVRELDGGRGEADPPRVARQVTDEGSVDLQDVDGRDA
jgi:hypothetical protein